VVRDGKNQMLRKGREERKKERGGKERSRGRGRDGKGSL